MEKVVILIVVFLTSINIYGQESMKKVQLQEGVSNIEYNGINIGALLQVYDEKSETHLIGDVYLRVENNGEFIAEFYIDNHKSTKQYYTKIYKSYFLTFVIENNNKYLIIEQAHFGKEFALSSNGNSIIADKNNVVEIEITNYIQEWGYDGPLEDENRNYFTDVEYTLKVKVKDMVKSFSFYSSEVKGNFPIEMEGYYIQILSDLYQHSYCLIEMIINKKEDK